MKKITVLRQIAELETLGVADLRARWLALFGREAPTSNQATLVRRLAYRIQELAYGGLADEVRDQLRAQATTAGSRGANGASVSRLPRRKVVDAAPVVGTRFVREWHGERHEVTVVSGGFEWHGRPYRSLSAIARAITNSRWNGRLFFGLPPATRRKGAR